MGSGFERRELWRQAYRAYRASLKINDNGDVRSKYEKVLAEHGFRILSNTVDADSADPRICIVFSDKLAVTRTDLADYVTVEGGDNLAIEPSDTQICIDGIKHGSRYQVRVRGGLPSADGETLDHPAEINVYVRDRAPWVGFAGNDYVLPAGKGASIPIVSVNTDKAKATVYRIGDRGARRRDPVRRQLPPPARPLCRRHDQRQYRREGLGRRGHHPADAERERDHRDPDRRRGQGPQAGRLRHHRQGGGQGQHQTTTTTITARSPPSGSSSPISASPRSPAMTGCTPSCARCRRRRPCRASSSGWSPPMTTSSAKRSPTPTAMSASIPASPAAPAE